MQNSSAFFVFSLTTTMLLSATLKVGHLHTGAMENPTDINVKRHGRAYGHLLRRLRKGRNTSLPMMQLQPTSIPPPKPSKAKPQHAVSEEDVHR